MIPTILRLHTKLNLSKNSLPHHIRWCKYDIFPTTLPRPIWHATALLRLPRCIHHMKHRIFHRLIYLPYRSNSYGLHDLRSLRIKTRSLNRRIINPKPGMTSRVPSTIPHIRGAYIRKSKIRKEGFEPPAIGFKPTP